MTSLEQAYFNLQRLMILLLEKVGGSITLESLDLESPDLYGKGIQVSEPDFKTDSVTVRVISYLTNGEESK